MDKRFLESLKDILDFYSAETDREKMEKNLEMLLDEAYLQGWSDAKDDSEEEGGMCGLVENCYGR